MSTNRPMEDPGPDTARQQVERMVRRYAARGPYCLSSDQVTVAHVIAGLTRNLRVHGRTYCPCREVTGDPARDRANLCPCPQHREDIARDGSCECGLFARREDAPAGQPRSPRGRAKER